MYMRIYIWWPASRTTTRRVNQDPGGPRLVLHAASGLAAPVKERSPALQFLVLMPAGWVDREQQGVIDSLWGESAILHVGRRLRVDFLTDVEGALTMADHHKNGSAPFLRHNRLTSLARNKRFEPMTHSFEDDRTSFDVSFFRRNVRVLALRLVA